VLVIGVGNELRGDDGAGIAVARRLADRVKQSGIEVREHQGEPTRLLDVWQDADAVVLVDTMHSGATAGTIRRFDARCEPLPARLGGSSSTHAFALDEAIELGRALHRLPERLIVFTVEGRVFAAGVGLSAALEPVLPSLADRVLREAVTLAGADPRAGGVGQS
jgi:hydrogenase maturation protease